MVSNYLQWTGPKQYIIKEIEKRKKTLKESDKL